MFITNADERRLQERLKVLIENSKELKFLVGFFYFSGASVLYKTLKALDEKGKLKEGFLKVLVGFYVDKGIHGLYEFSKEPFNLGQAKEWFLQSIKQAFTSKELDTQEFYEQAKFFLKLLEEKKLILRKTRKPNHAKLYLFKMDDHIGRVLPNLFITGSSNLTKAGLSLQEEFNVEVKDYGFEEAEKYFNHLWTNSVELTEKDVKQILEVIETQTMLKEITPFEAYAYLLKLYLELHAGEVPKDLREFMEEKGYRPFTYQLEAVSQAVANIKIHNGTLIADVVGLGKTVIACLTAKALGGKGIVICPPHLIGNENAGWLKYLEDFELYHWKVFSLGNLRGALNYVCKRPDIQVVIVDEAHRFRNEKTQRYHLLREICRGKQVILLTATPFNNRPSDLFSLIKLFTVPQKSSIVLDEDLYSKFAKYESEYRKIAYIRHYHNSKNEKQREKAKAYYRSLFHNELFITEIDLQKVNQRAKNLSKKIKHILNPVVIRRNRLDLKHYEEKIDLPEVKDPQEWFFELTKEQLDFYDEVIQSFAPLEEGGRFTGAIYYPARYENEDKEDKFDLLYQSNLYGFMRKLMVKRFESSLGAFLQSLRNFKEAHIKVLEFATKTNHFVLDERLMKNLLEETEEEEIERKLKEYAEEEELEKEQIKKYHKVYKLSQFKKKKEFLQDIEKDIALFEHLEKRIEKLGLINEDPKARRLIEGIKDFLKENRKVVVFTEYMDTALYLKDILEKVFGNKLLSAIGPISKQTSLAILSNFDAKYENQKDEHCVLLTTDKLSEGFNLSRAGVVINYDIPWNPVRVIQRVGRINRIGAKVYNELYIVNFFPTEKGATITRSREIAMTKMFMIHHILGEDAKIFAPDEEPKPSELYRRLNQYKEEEEESFIAKLKKEYAELVKTYPWLEERIKNLPPRLKVSKWGQKDELIVFIRKGKDLYVSHADYQRAKISMLTFEDAYESIKATIKDEALKPSAKFWTFYKKIEELIEQKNNLIIGSPLYTKAKERLKEILKRNDLYEPNVREFLEKVIKDIDNYKTLSEYVIRKIAEWSEDISVEEIKSIMEEIGLDFLERTLKNANLTDFTQEIIVAVENRQKE